MSKNCNLVSNAATGSTDVLVQPDMCNDDAGSSKIARAGLKTLQAVRNIRWSD